MNPPSRQGPSTAAVGLALLIVYVVGGSTYLAIAVMIETLPPLLAAGVRFLVAGALVLGALVAHARWRRRPLERPKLVHWRSAAVVGTLLLLGGNGGVVLAELRIPSGVAAVLVATTPIWLAVFDSILTRRRPSGLVIGGIVAGIIGSRFCSRRSRASGSSIRWASAWSSWRRSPGPPAPSTPGTRRCRGRGCC